MKKPWTKRIELIIVGIILIALGIYSGARPVGIEPDDYVQLSDTLSSHIVFAEGSQSNFRFIEFRLKSAGYRKATFRFKYIFDGINQEKAREYMQEGAPITILITTEAWEQHSRVVDKDENGTPRLQEGFIEVFGAEVAGKNLFDLKDLARFKKNERWYALPIIGFGLLFLISGLLVASGRWSYPSFFMVLVVCIILAWFSRYLINVL